MNLHLSFGPYLFPTKSLKVGKFSQIGSGNISHVFVRHEFRVLLNRRQISKSLFIEIRMNSTLMTGQCHAALRDVTSPLLNLMI